MVHDGTNRKELGNIYLLACMFKQIRSRPPGTFKDRFSGKVYNEHTVALPSRRKWETALLIPIAIIAPPLAFYLDGASTSTVVVSIIYLVVGLGLWWPFVSIRALLYISISDLHRERTSPMRRRLWLDDSAYRNRTHASYQSFNRGFSGGADVGGGCGGHGAGCGSSLSFTSRRTLTVHVAG